MIQAELLGRKNGQPFYGVTHREKIGDRYSLEILYEGTKTQVLAFLCGMLGKAAKA